MLEVVSIGQAREAGLKRFFTGRPCGRGHVSERHVSNGECIACARERFLRIQKKNRAAFNKRQQEWRAKNVDHARAYHRNRYRDNAQEFSEIARQRRAENPEPRRRSNAKWKRENRDKVAADRAYRRAKESDATPSWVCKKEIRKIYRRARYRREAGEDVHVDHIVPLISPHVCGLHVPWNLQIIPATENFSKNNRFDLEEGADYLRWKRK